MLSISTFAILFCWVTVSFVPNGSSVQALSVNANMSCTPFQTECALGCCPYQAGVCCADGFECCQHGQTCIPFVGFCIGLQQSVDGEMSLVSTKSTPVESLITPCPPGTTTCGVDKCCRYPDATCCSDGDHCCPHGYRCDLAHQRCIRRSFNELAGGWESKSGMAFAKPLKTIKKSPYKSCPGGGKVCPSYTSCCIDDNEQWGCCPNPSLSQYGAGGQCCDTIFGHMCCPDLLPVCTNLGCI